MRTKPVAAALTTLTLTALAVAHVDDPKERDRQRPYIGPMYASDVQGIAGGPGLEFPADNVQLLAWIPVTVFNAGNTSASTVEGYVSPSGREYAVVGLSDGTGFVEVTTPGNPTIVKFISGPDSLWKDVRVFQHFAYSVSEGGSGIQVMDMSQIDNGDVTLVGTVTTPAGTSASTHTMFINQESARLYRAGGSSNGLRIYSLADPANPTYIGAWPDRYVHEATIVNYTDGPFAGHEIAFCCGGFNGGNVDTGLYIVDITNLLDGNPNNGDPLLSYYQYPQARFSHQGWLSEDRHYFYLDDELDESQFGLLSVTRVIDVSDLDNPTLASTFTSGAGSVDHNLYVKGNLIFESNYRSGLRVFDATDPLAPVEYAYFDTYPESNSPNFNGLWDNYPYLPSGIVLGTDIEKGFFVWHVGPPALSIGYPDGRPDLIAPTGDSMIVSITSKNDELLEGSATLNYAVDGGPFTSVPLAPLGNDLFSADFPAISCGAPVKYYISAQTADKETVNSPQAAPSSTFDAFASFGELTSLLDNLETNTNWVVGFHSDNATSGVWVRVDPVGTTAQPENDHTPNPASMCWVTGQGAIGGGAGDADVDGGTTTLTSPALDATGGDGAPVMLEYYRWYSNNKGGNPNSDSMLVQLSSNNGLNWTTIETVTDNADAWVRKSITISDFLTPSNQMKVRFIASDLGDGSLVEAGVDDLRIYFNDCTPPMVGDITGDNVVDVDDLLELINQWGPCSAPPASCDGDLNGDLVVDVDDLLLVINNWSL